MNFKRLDADELAGIGIWFETEEGTGNVADLIFRELEIRIGEEISSRMTKEPLEEFDSCEESEEGQKWLEINCPEYRQVVFRKIDEFEQEIVKHKHMIAGIIWEHFVRIC